MKNIEDITEKEIALIERKYFDMVQVWQSKEEFYDTIFSTAQDLRLTFISALQVRDWLIENGYELPTDYKRVKT